MNQQFPGYGPTPHPEDRDDFGAATPPAAGYAGYSSTPNYSQPINAAGSQQPPSVMTAFKAGFSATFRNAAVWIGASAIIGVLFFLMGIGVGIAGSTDAADLDSVNIAPGPFDLLSTILGVVISVFAIRLALFTVDLPKVTWSHIGKDLPFWRVLGASVLMQFIIFLVAIIPAFLVAMPMLNGGTVPDVDDTEAVGAFFGALFGALAVLMIVSMLVSPLVILLPYAVADGRSLGEGLRLGAKNYGRLLGLSVLLSLTSVLAAIVTLGLALVIMIPVLYIAQAHFYRQVAGQAAPATPAF